MSEQLSHHQHVLLQALHVRARTIDELRERRSYAVRTVRACLRRGLVSTHGTYGQLVELTDKGRRAIGADGEAPA